MAEQQHLFERPNVIERLFNQCIGALVRLGLGPRDMRVLEVRGRKSGKIYSLPVDLLSADGRLYLVAPRGYTQWVRNVETQGQVTLRRGSQVAQYRLRALLASEKPPILKAYLECFRREVQRFFPVPADSPVEAFVPLSQRYPAFEVIQKNGRKDEPRFKDGKPVKKKTTSR